MKEEATKERKNFSYLWIILLIIIGVWFYVKMQPDTNMTFVVGSGERWFNCWNDTLNITVSYDLSSDSPVDLIFTPTQEDIVNLTETSQHYPSCYLPNILKTKGSCITSGTGCIALLNKKTNEATISLKYSARVING